MTDEEFMIGVRERLLNDKQILIATCNEFANINIEDLEKKLKIVIEALKDIYDKADEIYFDQDRTSLFCKQVRGISIQALKELE